MLLPSFANSCVPSLHNLRSTVYFSNYGSRSEISSFIRHETKRTSPCIRIPNNSVETKHLNFSVERRSVISNALLLLYFVFGKRSDAEDQAVPGTGETILLIGARGAIGQYVTRELQTRGCKIRGLTRYPKEAGEVLGTTVEWVGGDLRKQEILDDANFFRNLVSGVDRVVFAAGAHGWESLDNNRLIYSVAMRALLRAAKESGSIRRVVLISSGGVSRALDGYDDYIQDVFRWKRDGEEVLRASGLPYTVLRLYAYYQKPVPPAAVVLTQGDDPDDGGPVSLANIAAVTAECLFSPAAAGKTMEVKDAPRPPPSESPATAAATGAWREALAALVADP